MIDHPEMTGFEQGAHDGHGRAGHGAKISPAADGATTLAVCHQIAQRTCGAPSGRRKPCGQRAGHGTAHRGQGPCAHHGGHTWQPVELRDPAEARVMLGHAFEAFDAVIDCAGPAPVSVAEILATGTNRQRSAKRAPGRQTVSLIGISRRYAVSVEALDGREGRLVCLRLFNVRVGAPPEPVLPARITIGADLIPQLVAAMTRATQLPRRTAEISDPTADA